MQVDMELFWNKLEALGDMDAVVLATSQDDIVTARPIGALPYGGEILFRTDSDSQKAMQMQANPNVALTLGLDFYLRGTARFIGKCTDDANPEVQKAKAAYVKRWPDGFKEGDTYLSGKEVFVAVKPVHASQWVFEDNVPTGFVQQDL